MKVLLMFSIILVLFGELLVLSLAVSVRKNGPVYGKSGSAEYPDDHKRDLTNTDETADMRITQVDNWPDKNIKLGQVSSVSIDNRGNIYVFHRGDRTWNIETFYYNNTYKNRDLGPISLPTIAVIHPQTGALLYEWGKNIFYLPHGITVDNDNNVWVTDVALHQVMKFPPIYPKNNNTKPSLVLGTPFILGNNETMFCKPTAVAVLSNGDFFVSDGYCNSRILKYDANGTYLTSWGRSTLTADPVTVPAYHFNIPHDLTLLEDRNELCVSDRENGRILCYTTNNGSFVSEINLKSEVGNKVYAASYAPVAGGLFFVVNTAGDNGPGISHGSVVSAFSEHFVKSFQPLNTTFRTPHDIMVSKNATSVYVAELTPNRIWKFKISGLNSNPSDAISKSNDDELPYLTQGNKLIADGKSSGTLVMAMIITAAVLCFGAALLIAALIYSRARTHGCSGQCKNPKWLVGRSSVEGFKLGNFLGQQHQGFIKLNNFEESDEDESNASPTFA
ncbi:peptidyl-alpha-hydroxyglycine alpha-amidating lyase 1-like isoform X2 [Planococcus citri]|uniref:peptidyl-alpha-hydroxyglycine alpha-amidating lyase 1-like isoform X2 n=1 Tax=Planococcus citri TaxID=170843 RepID=UPI0031F7CE86